ncbi:hypothetical protein LCGC14_1127010 [marine sediment metagenome]|uniref:Uncharacterized protein n=1 Tax=marine sediment metagenome TaxID=412755 RepID=A0A0F9Q822_9ZZZZ
MAVIDKQLVFGDGLDVGISIGSVISTNVIELIAGKNYKRFSGAATKYADPSDTGLLRLLVKVTDEILVAAVSGATLKMDLMSHSTATVTSGTIIDSKTIEVTTDRAIGAILWDIGLPVDVINVTQFFGMNFTVAVQNMSSGKLFAALMVGAEKTSEE